jgi:hypothetical protein
MAKATDNGKSEYVKARIKRIVALDGLIIRPNGSGRNMTPIEGVIPRERAVACGVEDVEILGDATAKEFAAFVASYAQSH